MGKDKEKSCHVLGFCDSSHSVFPSATVMQNAVPFFFLRAGHMSCLCKLCSVFVNAPWVLLGEGNLCVVLVSLFFLFSCFPVSLQLARSALSGHEVLALPSRMSQVHVKLSKWVFLGDRQDIHMDTRHWYSSESACLDVHLPGLSTPEDYGRALSSPLSAEINSNFRERRKAGWQRKLVFPQRGEQGICWKRGALKVWILFPAVTVGSWATSLISPINLDLRSQGKT